MNIFNFDEFVPYNIFYDGFTFFQLNKYEIEQVNDLVNMPIMKNNIDKYCSRFISNTLRVSLGSSYKKQKNKVDSDKKNSLKYNISQDLENTIKNNFDITTIYNINVFNDKYMKFLERFIRSVSYYGVAVWYLKKKKNTEMFYPKLVDFDSVKVFVGRDVNTKEKHYLCTNNYDSFVYGKKKHMLDYEKYFTHPSLESKRMYSYLMNGRTSYNYKILEPYHLKKLFVYQDGEDSPNADGTLRSKVSCFIRNFTNQNKITEYLLKAQMQEANPDVYICTNLPASVTKKEFEDFNKMTIQKNESVEDFPSYLKNIDVPNQEISLQTEAIEKYKETVLTVKSGDSGLNRMERRLGPNQYPKIIEQKRKFFDFKLIDPKKLDRNVADMFGNDYEVDEADVKFKKKKKSVKSDIMFLTPIIHRWEKFLTKIFLFANKGNFKIMEDIFVLGFLRASFYAKLIARENEVRKKYINLSKEKNIKNITETPEYLNNDKNKQLFKKKKRNFQ